MITYPFKNCKRKKMIVESCYSSFIFGVLISIYLFSECRVNGIRIKMSSRSLPATRLINVGQNGVGRYVCQLARITLRFCKHQASSRGMR